MTLTDAHCEKLSEIFFSRSGIRLAANRRESLAARVRTRMRELGLKTINEYLARITCGPDAVEEARTFVETLLIGETSFFRDQEQLEALCREAAPALMSRLGSGRRKVVIWSVGCSVGCEPYTIAMMLSEHLPPWSIQVLATDLNQASLDHAKTGEYTPRYVKNVPDRFLSNSLYFKPAGKHYRVSDTIRNMVSFDPHNLLEDRYPTKVDMILCRNVLIYFDDAMIEAIVRKFHRSLVQGGFLCVGSTDNLLGYDAFFESLRVSESTVYRHWTTERRDEHSIGRTETSNKRRRRWTETKIESTQDHGTVTLTITGVAEERAEHFDARLAEMIPAGCKHLLIDLTNMLYMTNEAIHGLLCLTRRKRETIQEIVISAPESYLGDCLTRVKWGSRVKLVKDAPGIKTRHHSSPTPRPLAPPHILEEKVTLSHGPHHPTAKAPRVTHDKPHHVPRPAGKPARPYLLTRLEDGGVVILKCAGDLDAERSPEIYEELNRHLRPMINAHQPKIVIDLAEVSYIDDTHVAVLSRAARLAREHRGEMLVSTRSDSITRILSRQTEPMQVADCAADAVHILTERSHHHP